jgi:pimeloyl-ACP methyl ester carboxylesterase/DNA-binding CsgD family transcriptional regulator
LRLILSVAAGGVRASEGATRLFADLFGLSLRQAELARALAHGATRDSAADALGISHHGGKADLKVVFQACGVANAVDLARLVAEVDALIGLATACSVEIEPREGDAEPLRLIARSWAPGRIAVTDHGPGRGRPLLIFHTAVGGRHQPRQLIAALQAAGWRPISFDRPGYGLSDMVETDPFAAAAADVADILDALEIDRVTIMARSGSTAAVTTAAAMPDRIAGGLLIGPDPPVDLDSRYAGMMGRGKALFFGNSALAAAFARILSRRTSSAQITRMQRQSVAGSAIDEAVFDDPDTVADIVRASRQAALGMKGFLAEMQAHGGGARPPALAQADDWVVMAGAKDPLYDFETSRDFWQATLPGAVVQIIPDGGRWLHLTHTEAIVAALASVAARW